MSHDDLNTLQAALSALVATSQDDGLDLKELEVVLLGVMDDAKEYLAENFSWDGTAWVANS